jgi:hypothetical protein
MIFAVVGLFFLGKRVKDMKIAIPIFTVLALYILASWWCWWFGGSFGMRAMIQYYSLLAFPLAAFLHFLFQKKIRTIIAGPVILFFVYYSLLYSYKYRFWSVHYDSMSKEAYWYTFMDPKLSEQEIGHMQTLLEVPNSDEAKIGNR